MAPSVTTRDPKGLKFISVAESAYNKAGLTEEEAQRVNDSPGLGKLIGDFIALNRRLVSKDILEWEKFYRDYFGLECDFSGINIPARRKGFDRLIIVAAGLTANQAFEACEKHFPCWRYNDDLNTAVPTNDRDPAKGAYAIWVRDRQEADEEWQNNSANDLKKKNIAGITLVERLVYGLKYFAETGKHLDVEKLTLCSGSRYSDGHVPYVDCHDDKLRVTWYYPGYARDYLRVREAVS